MPALRGRGLTLISDRFSLPQPLEKCKWFLQDFSGFFGGNASFPLSQLRKEENTSNQKKKHAEKRAFGGRGGT